MGIIEKLMVEAFALSDQGCVRSNNEDYYLVAANIGLYVLADGMGGAAAGERASKLASDKVWEVVYNSLQTGEQPSIDMMVRAFEEANQCVINEAQLDLSLDGMGTTLVVAQEAVDELLIASVGDSRAYSFHEAKLQQITADQTWVQEVGRRLGIDEENLRTHPMRHVLTMAIGVSPQLRINTYRTKPEVGSQVLLCSDGLHGVIDEVFIASVLATEATLEEKCHHLIDGAKAAGGPDNITAVLMRMVPGDAPALPTGPAEASATQRTGE
jgi:serine/threonine protein phosphatase PrpC